MWVAGVPGYVGKHTPCITPAKSRHQQSRDPYLPATDHLLPTWTPWNMQCSSRQLEHSSQQAFIHGLYHCRANVQHRVQARSPSLQPAGILTWGANCNKQTKLPRWEPQAQASTATAPNFLAPSARGTNDCDTTRVATGTRPFFHCHDPFSSLFRIFQPSSKVSSPPALHSSLIYDRDPTGRRPYSVLPLVHRHLAHCGAFPTSHVLTSTATRTTLLSQRREPPSASRHHGAAGRHVRPGHRNL